MSKVPYTIDVDRYVCAELENIRTMLKTFDFSMLPATIERIQYHVSAMEEALYRYDGIKRTLSEMEDEAVDDKQFRANVKRRLEGFKKK